MKRKSILIALIFLSACILVACVASNMAKKAEEKRVAEEAAVVATRKAQEQQITQEIKDAQRLLDQCCPSSDELAQAKDKLQNALQSDPSNRFALLASARWELKNAFLGYHFTRNHGAYPYEVSAFSEGALNRAETITRNIISSNPNFGDAYSYLGYIRFSDNGVDEAETLLARAEALGSTDPLQDIRWTMVQFAEGNVDAGREKLRRILDDGAANDRVKRQARELQIDDFERSKLYDQGKKVYEELIASYPADIDLRVNFSQYLSDNLNLNDEAIAIGSLDPPISTNGSGRRVLAFAMYRKWADLLVKRKATEANVYFEQAQQLNPDLDGAMLYAGSAPACRNLVNALIKYKRVSVETTASDGSTALLIATNKDLTDVVRFLLSRNASPNVLDEKGWTPLLSAAQDGNRELAAMLVAAGADPNVSMHGKTPAAYAMDNHNLEMAAWLDGLRKH